MSNYGTNTAGGFVRSTKSEKPTLTCRQRRSLHRKAAILFPVLVVSFVVTCASAQNIVSDTSSLKRAWPHPYAYGGLSLNGGGYAPLSETVGGGFDIDTKHFVWNAEVSYDNAHKSNDGTVGNKNGHDRYAQSRAFYRVKNGSYFGGGAQWNQLSTTLYKKQSWHPTFGGGKDWIREGSRGVGDFSMRGQVVYVLPGSDHLNAVQGPEISIWIPSPSTNHHLFYRQTLGVYEFHQTAVSGNPGTQNRSVASFLDFTIMYRF